MKTRSQNTFLPTNNNENSDIKIRGIKINLNTLKNDDEYSDEDFEIEESSTEESEMTDIDIKNKNKIVFVSRYAEKILINALIEENQQVINSEDFLKHQTEITPRIRSILVKWLISVHHHFSNIPDTLFNSVMLFDLVLSRMKVKKSDIQIIGSVCLLISSKVEEFFPISINEFIEYCENPYKVSDFVNYETILLKILNFKLSYPTIQTFLTRYLISVQADQHLIEVCSFLSETTLLCPEIILHRQSSIALSIIILGFIGLSRECPIQQLKFYSHHKNLKPIFPCITFVLQSAKSILESKKGSIYQKFTDFSTQTSILFLKFPNDIINLIKKM